MAIAPTGEGLAFGDAEGYVHLWAAQEDAKFCRYEAEIELPDAVEPPEQIEWRDDTCVSTLFSLYPSILNELTAWQSAEFYWHALLRQTSPLAPSRYLRLRSLTHSSHT